MQIKNIVEYNQAIVQEVADARSRISKSNMGGHYWLAETMAAIAKRVGVTTERAEKRRLLLDLAARALMNLRELDES